MAYTGSSIVDYLNSIGQPSSFAARTALATQHGITNYTGTADQNLSLLNTLRSTPAYAGPNFNTTVQPTTKTTVGTIGTWIDSTTGQGYSGPKRNENDTAGNATTGQPVISGGGGTGGGTGEGSGASGGNGGSGGGSGGGTGGTTQFTLDQATHDKLIGMGLSEAQIASLSQGDIAMFSAMSDYITKQNSNGTTGAFDINQALAAAQNDPDIAAKYGDSLKTGLADFARGVNQLQTGANIWSNQQSQDMENARKNLQDTEAGAGRAYSGFRQQANQQLKNTQTGVIQSEKSQLEKNVADMGSAFEKQYGTTATPANNMTFNNPLTGTQENIGYNPVGGITGTNPLSEKGDILTKQSDLMSLNTNK